MRVWEWLREMSGFALLLVVLVSTIGTSLLGSYVMAYRPAWQIPGCHRLGHTRLVTIPGCVAFTLTTNACRGFCTSYAIPSEPQPLDHPDQPYAYHVTSRAECCGIMDTHDVEVAVRCQDLNGQHYFRNLTFKSAATCECSMCRWT